MTRKRMPATIRLACVSKPPPVLPLARLLDGKSCVSRPFEGLDSHGAICTLRMTWGLANRSASRWYSDVGV
jgi:hypothetical protein